VLHQRPFDREAATALRGSSGVCSPCARRDPWGTYGYKHLAQTTSLRGDSRDYAPMLSVLEPRMMKLFDEIAAKKEKRGI